MLAQIFDNYSRQARLAPALFLLLPLLVSCAVWFPAHFRAGSALALVIVGCGGTLFLAHLARSKGRKLEDKLYLKWGGKPSTAWLRHSDNNIDVITKQRYHSILNTRIANWAAPMPEAEIANPKSAEQMYETATQWLLTQTRDTKRFPLIFKENVSYGFRRNLFGLRPFGIAISTLCVIANSMVIGRMFFSAAIVSADGILALSLSLASLLSWLFVIRENWVRDAANGYARALLSSCESLSAESTHN